MSYFARIAARVRRGLDAAHTDTAPRDVATAGVVPAVSSRSPIAQVDQRWNVPPLDAFEGGNQDAGDIERIEAFDETSPPIDADPTAVGVRHDAVGDQKAIRFAPELLEFAHRPFPLAAPLSRAMALPPIPPLSDLAGSPQGPAVQPPTTARESEPVEPATVNESWANAKVPNEAAPTVVSTEPFLAADFEMHEQAATSSPSSSVEAEPPSAPFAPYATPHDAPRAEATGTLEPKLDANASLRRALSALGRWLEAPPSEIGEHRGVAADPPSSSEPVAASIPAYAAPSSRSIEPTHRSDSFIEEASAPTRPRIEIGRIDVQVVAPPPPATHSAPRPPRRALATSPPSAGPSLVFGWRQR